MVEGDRISYIHVIATSRFVIAAYRGTSDLIRTLTTRASHDRPTDPEAAFFLLLGGVVESFRREALKVAHDLEELEDDMFEQLRQQQLVRLAHLRRRLALLYREITPYAEATKTSVTLMAVRHKVIHKHRELIRAHERDVRLLVTTIESLRDSTQHAVDNYSSLLATEQNAVINRLTIVSSIFLPLTFLTGFFGMNFGYLLDVQKGQSSLWILGIGLQFGSLVLALYLIYRMGIWRTIPTTGKLPTADER